jgi:hypothetical protein
MSQRKKSRKRRRDCIFDHNDLPSFLNGVCDCEIEEEDDDDIIIPKVMIDQSTQTEDCYTNTAIHKKYTKQLDIPDAINEFILQDIELYNMHKKVKELQVSHQNKYSDGYRIINNTNSCREAQHIWWLFMIKDYNEKNNIDHFLLYFSNRWDPKYNLETV